MIDPAGLDLFGRDREVADLPRLLARPEVRVLTLVGPAGVGKTSLAQTVVSVRRRTPALRVDLAGVTDHKEAAGRVAAAFGIRVDVADASRAVEDHIGPESVVLYLDECELCRDLPRLLTPWLARCGRLRILATSHRALQVASEQVYPIAPLEVPPPQWDGNVATLAAVASVALFTHRVRSRRPRWRLDGRNADRVTAICRATDGLPLALELAAARLGRSSHDSAEPRSLDESIARSYDLLTEHAQQLLRRLSVFPGSWTASAAEQVCAEPGDDVRAALTELTDASLVAWSPRGAGVPGYVMLRAIADFAARRLAASGEEAAMGDRHLRYFAGLAREAEHGFGTLDEGLLVEWLGTEYADLRAAFSHARRRRDSAATLLLAAAIGWHCFTHGRLQDGLQLTRTALAETSDGQGPERAACLLAAGILACLQGEHAEAGAWLGAALSSLRRSGDRRGCAIAEAFLGHTSRLEGRYERAAGHYRNARDIQTELDNARGVVWSEHDLGLLALERGDADEAEQRLTAAERWFVEAGDEWALAWVRLALGMNALRRGRVEDAVAWLGESLVSHTRSQDRRGIRECLVGFAEAALVLGRDREAARLEGAALARPEFDTVPTWLHSRPPAQLRVAAIDRFGRAAFEAERHAGAAMRLPAACDLAYSLAARGHLPPSLLTPREQEVAALVATGATNRQIGVRLNMAEKTVETHLTRIMAKLGVDNRTQVARHPAVGPE